MTDLYQVLFQKEMDIKRVQREIEALKFVIPMLTEDAEPDPPSRPVEWREVPQSGRNGKGGAEGWP